MMSYLLCRVPTTWHHSSRSAVFRQAIWMPKLIGLTSSGTTRSHVELGLPWGRFLQDDGSFCIAARKARRWTLVGCARATWPKKRSLLARTMSETGWHCVTCPISAFVTCFVQGMRRISRRHQSNWVYTSAQLLRCCGQLQSYTPVFVAFLWGPWFSPIASTLQAASAPAFSSMGQWGTMVRARGGVEQSESVRSSSLLVWCTSRLKSLQQIASNDQILHVSRKAVL